MKNISINKKPLNLRQKRTSRALKQCQSVDLPYRSITGFKWVTLFIALAFTIGTTSTPSLAASTLPDLIVTQLSYNNGNFTSTVTNQGTAATPAGMGVGVGYFVDGVQHTWGGLNPGPLAAGASTIISSDGLPWNGGPYIIPDGTHTITAYVDDVNHIAELDETNNKMILSITQVTAPPSSTPVAAFPGAQGGGAASVGGRGGAVIEVTNLNDFGAGSLRACVAASGPRTCVFRVGGTITLSAPIVVSNPYITVAGQTAPGGGIMLKGYGVDLVTIWTHDVIWRYTKLRNGYSSACHQACGGNLSIDGNNIIADHNSTSWNTGQGQGIGGWGFEGTTDPRNNTVSYNLVAEGLADHSTGFLTGGKNAANQINYDFHHNFVTSNGHRNPLAGHMSMRWVNNIGYNMRAHANQLLGGGSFDIIGNIYKRGPLTNPWYHEVQASTDLGLRASVVGNPSIYMLGNIGWSQSDPSGDQWLMANQVLSYNGGDAGAIPSGWRRTTHLADTAYPIIAEPVATLEANLLNIVGASRRLACDGSWVANRDSVDTQRITQYRTNSGNTFIPTTENEVGGFPVIAGDTPCSDADHDGMPDVWETARGLNPNNAADGNTIAANGYTKVENYLNGM